MKIARDEVREEELSKKEKVFGFSVLVSHWKVLSKK
jgi:hypothetical protein